MNFRKQFASIDHQALTTKNNAFKLQHKEDLMGVLRYAHAGQTFPLEIESAVVLYARNHKIRQPGQTLTRNHSLGSPKTDTITLIGTESRSNDSLTAAGFLINDKQVEVGFDRVVDSRRSHLSDPVREIVYQDKKYRTVPYNGDVWQHQEYQTDSFKKFFLSSLISGGMMSTTDAAHMDQYNQIHDMPELDTGDEFGFSKSAQSVEKDPIILAQQLAHSGLYTTAEKAYHIANCIRHEGKHTLFGVGEMLGYIADAIHSSEYPEYFGQQSLFPAGVVQASGSKFVNPHKTAYFKDEHDCEHHIPYKEIAPISEFLDAHRDDITQIITQAKEQAPLPSMSPTHQRDRVDRVDRLVTDLYDAYKL